MARSQSKQQHGQPSKSSSAKASSSSDKNQQPPSSNLTARQAGTAAGSSGLADGSSALTAWSSTSDQASAFYAQVSAAISVDTVRIFDISTGQCTARWASSESDERVASIEWVDVKTASSEAEKNDGKNGSRSKKRRKSDSTMVDASTSANGLDTSSSSSNSGSYPALAVGLSNGSVIILHPTESSVLQKLGAPAPHTPIRSLSYLASTGERIPSTLFALFADGRIAAWTLPTLSGQRGHLVALYTGAAAGSAALRVRSSRGSPKSSTSLDTLQVLVGQHGISLLEGPLPIHFSQQSQLATHALKSVATFSGHATEVVDVVWLPDNNEEATSSVRFASIAQSDRFAHIWTTHSADGEEASEGRLVGTLGLDDDLVKLFFSSEVDILGAVSTSGSVSLAHITSDVLKPKVQPEGNPKKQRRRSMVATITPDTKLSSPASSEPVKDVTFLDDRTILVSRGYVKPAFESLSIRDADGSFRSQIRLSETKTSSGLLTQDNTADMSIRSQYRETPQTAVMSGAASVVPSAAAKSAMKGSTSQTEEPTLAERVKAIEMNSSKAPGDGLQTLDAEGKKRIKPAKVMATASSLSASLVQALHSGDTGLLESSISQTDSTIIRNTVQRIPEKLVLPLVEALTDRLTRNKVATSTSSGISRLDPGRGKTLVEWLRAVMLLHLGYLLTVPYLVERMAPLQALLDARTACHAQLLALSGRLDLVATQIEMRRRENEPKQDGRNGKKGAKTSTVPLNRYVEGQSESSSEEEQEEEDANDDEQDDSESDDEDVEAAEENGEIEDIVLQRPDEDTESDDEEDESEPEQSKSMQPRSKARHSKAAAISRAAQPPVKVEKPTKNGFLDLEAEESENEGSDEDLGLPDGLRANKTGNSDEEDEEDDEDLDRYESDFIDDEVDEDGSEEDEEEDDEEDDE